MQRVRLNLIIERDEDDWVYCELASVPKGPKRIAKAKRMLHVAALIQKGLLQPANPIGAATGYASPHPKQTASAPPGRARATADDITSLLGPGVEQ